MSLKKNPIFDIFNTYVIGYECKSKNIRIEMCEKNQADNVIIKNHYSKKPTKNSFLSLLVYYNNKVEGALQVGYGIRPEKNGKYQKNEVVEFDRICLLYTSPSPRD